jgi:hypothetical protein
VNHLPHCFARVGTRRAAARDVQLAACFQLCKSFGSPDERLGELAGYRRPGCRSCPVTCLRVPRHFRRIEGRGRREQAHARAPKLSTSKPGNLMAQRSLLALAAQSPPETVMSLPVTYDASGETSHDTAAAISSGRPSGLCVPMSCSSGLDAIAVSMHPGETLLTRIPAEATSLDNPRVKVTVAPLVASYGTSPVRPMGAWAAPEAM